ncbi:MAG: hypothetical protein V3U82_07690 [Robiginitomaculum sp.]
MIRETRLPARALTLLAIALTALPLAAVTSQALRLRTGQTLTLEAQIIAAQNDRLAPLARIQTPLHNVSLLELSGDNNFRVGDIAYLYVTQSGAQAYPFAISRHIPRRNIMAKNTVMLRAHITRQDGDTLSLSHSFDRLSPPSAFITAAHNNPALPVSLTLAISKDGRSSPSRFAIGEQVWD